jgi:hypothetical protein
VLSAPTGCASGGAIKMAELPTPPNLPDKHAEREDNHSDDHLRRTAEYRHPGIELDIVNCARSFGHKEPT